MDSFNFGSGKISEWKSTGIFIYLDSSMIVLKIQKQGCNVCLFTR